MRRNPRWSCFAAAMTLALAVGSSLHAQTVVHFATSLGDFNVELFDATAPRTVANFLDYVLDGDYVDSIFHRSLPGFVVQGGGFYADLSPVPQDAPVLNEFGAANARGTIAMAKPSGDPDGAKSQWFINLADNGFLDAQNGGYTVFGQVVAAGMETVDRIAGLDTLNGGPGFEDLPVLDASLGTASTNLVRIDGISIVPEPSGAAFALSALLVGLGVRCRRRRRQGE